MGAIVGVKVEVIVVAAEVGDEVIGSVGFSEDSLVGESLPVCVGSMVSRSGTIELGESVLVLVGSIDGR